MQRGRHGKVARGLLHSHATDDVEKDVELSERQPGAFLEDREE